MYEEIAGIEVERRLAGALACSLLGCEACKDPRGEWGAGWTHAQDHFSYASVFEHQKRTAVVILPREPMTLTLCGYPERIAPPTPYSSTSHMAVFSVGGEDELHAAPEAPPPEPELHLDAGDALVLRGDRTEPPGGLGAGALIYAFEACDASDPCCLQRSPTLEMRAALERQLLR